MSDNKDIVCTTNQIVFAGLSAFFMKIRALGNTEIKIVTFLAAHIFLLLGKKKI